MVEEHAEDAAPVQNTIEFHQLQYLAAWLAMKRQTDQCSPNLDPPCLTAFVKRIEIDNDILAKITRAEPALRRD